jgi:hypothetical protein
MALPAGITRNHALVLRNQNHSSGVSRWARRITSSARNYCPGFFPARAPPIASLSHTYKTSTLKGFAFYRSPARRTKPKKKPRPPAKRVQKEGAPFRPTRPDNVFLPPGPGPLRPPLRHERRQRRRRRLPARGRRRARRGGRAQGADVVADAAVADGARRRVRLCRQRGRIGADRL